MNNSSPNPLIVCDIFIHSIIFHTLTNESLTLRGQHLNATDTAPPSLPSYHIGLQFTGTSTPIPSILIPITDQLTLSQKVALSLGQSETCIIEKGKSLCIHFPSSSLSSSDATVIPSSLPSLNNTVIPVPPQLSLVLLSSKETNQGAEFVGNGTVSLQPMVQKITTTTSPSTESLLSPLIETENNIPDDHGNNPYSSSSLSNHNSTILEQFRIPIYDLVTQKVASVLISVRLGCVPVHLHAYFAQQIVAQSAASFLTSNPSSPSASSPTFCLPVRNGTDSISVSTIVNDGIKKEMNFQRTIQKTIERGKKELSSTNVYVPPPIWYGNIGPITVPVVPPQPPSSTNTETSTLLPGGEPLTAPTSRSVPHRQPENTATTVHSIPLGFQHESTETPTLKPILGNDNETLSHLLTGGENDTETLDQLLAELIRWRDVVRHSDTEQQQSITSPKKEKGTTKPNLLTVNNPLKDGISSSMAALQKALLSSGITEGIANRLVQTLGRSHIHPLESSPKANLPSSIQDFVKRGVTFISSSDLHSHPLFGSEERTRILATAFPRTFRVLRGSDTPEEMQQAIDTIYSLQEQRKSLRSNVYKNGIVMNDPLSTSYASIPASPLAGSPLRSQQLSSTLKSPNKNNVQSPTGILRNKPGSNLNSSFSANNGIPLPSTLSNSPYAKAVLPPRRASTTGNKPSNTTPMNYPIRTNDASFYSTGTERRDSIGGRSTNSGNNENEPVRGVRLTTAMRARLAALEEEKRFERLQASREASILSAAEASGPIWVERERRRRLSHDRRHSTSTFRTEERTIDTEDKNNTTFNSDYVSQANKDARRSAGYRAPVEPNEIRSLRTSPHKHALELMPSARTKVSQAVVPGNPQSDRLSSNVPKETITVSSSSSVLRESVELPNTSVLVTSNPGQSSLIRSLNNDHSNTSTINRTSNGETFNITAYEDKKDTLLPSNEKFVPVVITNEESILQLSVSGSPSKLQSVLSPSQFVIDNGSDTSGNGGVPLYQTVDASMISSVPSAPSSSTNGGGENSQNITRKSDDSVHTPDLNVTGMSNTHLSALGLGLGATGKKGSKTDNEEEESSEQSGEGRSTKNLLGNLTSPLSDTSSYSEVPNRHSTFRSTDKYTNERVKAAMERIAAATSSDSFGSVSSDDIVLSPPSGMKSTNRSSRFALSGSSDDILIETSNDDDDDDETLGKNTRPYRNTTGRPFTADLGDEEEDEEEEEEEEDTDF